MAIKTYIVRSLLGVFLTITSLPVFGQPFADHSRPAQFLELQLHGLVGGSYLTNNYRSIFPVIRELDTTMGVSYGLGAGAVIPFRDFFGVGTELNLVVNHNRADIFTSNFTVQSASNLYLRNCYYGLNVPLYLTWRFNIGEGVRWNVDFGAYYSYGLGGSQEQALYRSLVNDLGQLVYQEEHYKPDFYNSDATFQNSYHRADLGLHFATGLTFHRHFFLAARAQIGVKNIAFVDNAITTPRVHTVSFLIQTGWKF